MNKNTVIDKCLETIPHRFELVILASQRARLLYLGAKSPIEHSDGIAKTDLALTEIAEGYCTRDSIIESFTSTVILDDNTETQEEIAVKDIKDGKGYDDFEIDDLECDQE